MHTTEQLNAALEGRYIIQRVIGEGGMATVFLARDVKHNRNVALKVLKPDLGVIVGVERFLAEIEVTANLQHPNLLPLFDSGAMDGVLFYVMPYVEGESLRARLDREKQLPVDEVVRMVSSIASALDYAHRHNVIHRDLKPENILLHDGQPLVADFGIALAVSKAGGNRITQTGLSLGTPQYMSPEQATGDRSVDARTDIYSLGAVTYEMLTGEAPHVGSTSQAVIARVLTERPRPIRSSRPSVPEHIEYAVEHALEKLPADRFASAKEFSEALGNARAMTSSPSRSAAPSTMEFVPARPARSRVLTALPWMLALSAMAAAAWAWRPHPVEPLIAARFTIELPDSVRVLPLLAGGSKVALSRDGTQMAVIAARPGGVPSVFLRRLGDPVAEQVRGTEGATSASFSSAGDWLLFVTTESQLRKVPVTGGQSTLLADSGGVADWGDGNQVLFNSRRGVWLTTSNGGEARQLVGRDSARRIDRVGFPEVLPGGTHALVTIRKGQNIIDSSYLAVVALKDGELTELDMAGTNPHYSPSGHVLFGRTGGDVYVAPFSLRSRTITGPAELLLQEVSQRTGGPTDFAIADNGTLVYHTGTVISTQSRYLALVDRQGVERQLSGDAAFYADPRVSPSGRLVTFNFRARGVMQQMDGDVFVDDIATGVRSRISSTGTSVRSEWSADGTHLYWIDQPKAESSFVRMRQWDRPGDGVILARGTANGLSALNTISVGPAGGWAAFRIGDNAGNTELWVAPMDSLNARRALVTTPFKESGAAVSPDGRLVAYVSDETGTPEIYVTTLPIAGARLAVSVGGGTEPAWSRDGKRLFFRSPTRMMEATITARPTLAVTRVDSLFADRYFTERWARQYDVHPNGQFLMLGLSGMAPSSATTGSNLNVVVNWPSLLGAGRGGR